MKIKKLEGKLSLNKKTISNLFEKTMEEAKGGILPAPLYTTKRTICYCSWVYSCDYATCQPSWCGQQCL